MPDLREAVLAELQRRIDLCRGATPGPWDILGGTHDCEVIDSHGGPLATTRRGGDPDNVAAPVDAGYIAAHDPQTMERVWLSVRSDVRAHAHPLDGTWCLDCPVYGAASIFGLEVPTDAR